MRSLARIIATAVVVTLALAGCGGDDSDSNTGPAAAEGSPAAEQAEGDEPAEPSGVTGCDLLTADEVASVVGNAVEASPFGDGCAYDGSDIGDVYPSFTTVDAGSDGDATVICEASLTALGDYEAVSGVGDSAYLETGTAELEFEPGKRLANASVVACTRRVVVSLALNGYRSEEQIGQMAVDLTKTIFDRI